jgi:hypothetical protein
MATNTKSRAKKPTIAKAKATGRPKKPAAAKPKAKSATKPAAGAKKVTARRASKPTAVRTASRPEVSEIVAAALVGAAAVLRDPRKARQLAASVGEEIEQAAKGAAGQGAAIWQLAMDVAKRSVDALGAAAKGDSKSKDKKKKKKKKK